MSSSHVALSADRTIDEVADLTPDVVIVCGGLEGHRYVNRRVISWLRDLDIRGAITGAVSTGVWSLAEARLLDGRRCAVHWDDIPSFSVRFPLVDVQRDIFAHDGRRLTCSGGTAVIDMMLHLLQLQHGKGLADDVAELLIHGRTRAGADKQRRGEGEAASAARPLRRAIALMQDHVEPTLSIDALASRLGLSTGGSNACSAAPSACHRNAITTSSGFIAPGSCSSRPICRSPRSRCDAAISRRPNFPPVSARASDFRRAGRGRRGFHHECRKEEILSFFDTRRPAGLSHHDKSATEQE